MSNTLYQRIMAAVDADPRFDQEDKRQLKEIVLKAILEEITMKGLLQTRDAEDLMQTLLEIIKPK